MSAQYDAGSIDATMRVDLDPFDEGLARAQEKARAFEDSDHSIPLHITDEQADEEIRRIQARMAELSDDGGFSLKVDTDEARAEVDALRARLDLLHNKDVTVRVNTEQSTSEVRRLGDEIDRVAGDSRGGSSGGEGGGGIGGLIAKVGLLGSLGGGLINPLLGEVLGLGGGFAIAGAGAAAFGLTAKADFTDMQTKLKAVTAAQQALTKATTDKQRITALHELAQANAALTGPERQAAEGYLKMKDAAAAFRKETAPAVYKALAGGMGLVTDILPKLVPLVNASATAFGGVFKQIDTAIQGPGFTKFINFLSKQIGPVLHSLTGTFIEFGKGFASALENSMPVVNVFLGQLHKLGAGFDSLTASPAFKEFMASLAKDMKQIGPVIGQIFGLLGHLLLDLQPLVAPVLDVISHIVKALDAVAGPLTGFLDVIAQGLDTIVKSGALDDLAKLFDAILIAVEPLIPLIANLAATILPPLLKMFTSLVNALAPFISQLVSDLEPMLPIIGKALNIVAQAFEQWWKALGPLIGQLLNALMPLLKPLVGLIIPIAQAFAAWVKVMTPLVQIAGVILVPIIKAIAQGLGFMVQIIGDVIGWFANLVTGGGNVGKMFQGLASMVGSVIHWLENLGKTIVGAVGSALHWMVNTGENIISGLWHGITGIWKTVSSWFAGMGHRVLGFFANAVGWLLGVGKNIITGLWHGIQNVWTTVVNFFDNIGGAIWSMLKGAVGAIWNDLLNIGEDIVNGIWDGIKDVWDEMTSWIHGNGPGIAKTIATSVGAHSRSEQTYKVGRDIGQGLYDGIADGFSMIPPMLIEQASKIKDYYSGIGNQTYQITAKASMSAASAAEAARTGAVVDLTAAVNDMHETIKRLPTKTGTAVGDIVADKFDKSARRAAKATVTANRKGGS